MVRFDVMEGLGRVDLLFTVSRWGAPMMPDVDVARFDTQAGSIAEVRAVLGEGIYLSDALIPRATPTGLNQLIPFDDQG